MKHSELIELLTKLTNVQPRIKDLAEGLGVSISTICARASRDSVYRNPDLVKLSDYFGVNLLKYVPKSYTEEEIEGKITAKLGRKLASRFAEIQYIEDLDNYNKPVRNPFVTEVIMDAQIIVYKWRCNIEDLRIISMFDDSMDGGEYAIKNGDILIVDTSVKTVTVSGLYLFIINNNELYIRRIIDTFRNSYIFSAKKNDYKIFEEEKTFEDLKNANFRILGRVVTDISYTI